MGRSAEGQPEEGLVLAADESSGYSLWCLISGQGARLGWASGGSPRVWSQGEDPQLWPTESRPGPGWPSHHPGHKQVGRSGGMWPLHDSQNPEPQH